MIRLAEKAIAGKRQVSVIRFIAVRFLARTARKRFMLLLIVVAALVLLGTGWAKQKALPPQRVIAPLQQTLDDQFAAVARRVPEFGGMFLGSNEQILQVYLTDTSPNRVAAVRQAIVAVFGAPTIPSGGIRPIKGQYQFLQLREWYTRMVGPVLSIPGVTATDINEATNRLVIGLEKREVEPPVLDAINRVNIPREAVVPVVTGPFVPLNHTVQSPNSMSPWPNPRQAGYVITRLINNVAGSSTGEGTLGFNALGQPNSMRGFVTCSHNTQLFWQLDSLGGFAPADFYQSSGYYPIHKVGTEFYDPPGFICPNPYPMTHTCRYSDSTFVKYDAGVQSAKGIIARTTGLTLLTTSTANIKLAINHTFQLFSVGTGIWGINSPPTMPYLVGLKLNKVGRTTGWTSGTLEYSYYPSTCADFVDSYQRIRLCQYTVGNQADNDPSNDNWQIGTFGDSGSPVFRISNGKWKYVELYGILWGGSDLQNNPTGSPGGRKFVFSPIGGVSFQQSGIQTDLGQLYYINECLPPISPNCRKESAAEVSGTWQRSGQ